MLINPYTWFFDRLIGESCVQKVSFFAKMNREGTADSTTFYDSHDDNEDDYDEVEDDDDGDGVRDCDHNGSVKGGAAIYKVNADKELSYKGQKPRGSLKKKKGSKKKRPSIVANLAATKFSVGGYHQSW